MQKIIKIFSISTKYRMLWPDDKYLGAMFKEVRLKRAYNLLKHIIPPFLCLEILWMFYIGGGFKGVPLSIVFSMHLPPMIISICFLLSIPLHLVLYFYYLSNKKLSQREYNVYLKLCKLAHVKAKGDPIMYDFATVLNKAMKKVKSHQELFNDLM